MKSTIINRMQLIDSLQDRMDAIINLGMNGATYDSEWTRFSRDIDTYVELKKLYLEPKEESTPTFFHDWEKEEYVFMRNERN